MSNVLDEPHICYHCGNEGMLTYIETVKTPYAEIEKDKYGREIYYDVVENVDWIIFQCPVCKNVVLISEYTSIVTPDGYGEITYEFPKVLVYSDGVPKNIKDAFDAAIKTKGIDCSICLLSLRRTLEMICKDK